MRQFAQGKDIIKKLVYCVARLLMMTNPYFLFFRCICFAPIFLACLAILGLTVGSYSSGGPKGAGLWWWFKKSGQTKCHHSSLGGGGIFIIIISTFQTKYHSRLCMYHNKKENAKFRNISEIKNQTTINKCHVNPASQARREGVSE